MLKYIADIPTVTMIAGIDDITRFLRPLIFPPSLEICGIEGKIQFLFLMTPYPTYKIQFNKKRGAQTDQNSVSLFFYAFLVFDYSDGYVQLHCL